MPVRVLLRRLHSLSGVIPVGAYMVVHLLTNSTILDSALTFQKNVYTIHSLGQILPLVEWVFIFIPLLFHAIFGVVIIRGGLPSRRNSTKRRLPPGDGRARLSVALSSVWVALTFLTPTL